jgi:Protein of unknown function (DUF3828)
MKTVLILTVLLTACGAEKKETPVVTTAPAVPAVAPDAVVSALYRAHAAEQSPFFQTTDRARLDQYFEPSLASLIWQDAVAANGEVGAIEFDPLYAAQDMEIKNLVVSPAQIDGNNGRVIVTFENFGEKQQLNYSLARVGNEWKITDIAYADGPTLRQMVIVEK